MSDFEEAAVIIKKEIKMLHNFKKFNQFICLCNIYHINQCEHDDCNNCDFVNEHERIYFKNYLDKVNGTESLQKCCREYHGNFFSLTSFLKCLASIEREKVKLELKFNNILQIWNASTKI